MSDPWQEAFEKWAEEESKNGPWCQDEYLLAKNVWRAAWNTRPVAMASVPREDIKREIMDTLTVNVAESCGPDNINFDEVTDAVCTLLTERARGE